MVQDRVGWTPGWSSRHRNNASHCVGPGLDPGDAEIQNSVFHWIASLCPSCALVVPLSQRNDIVMVHVMCNTQPPWCNMRTSFGQEGTAVCSRFSSVCLVCAGSAFAFLGSAARVL